MPVFEAIAETQNPHLFRAPLDGVRVHLSKNLGFFDLFPGTTLFMDEAKVIPREMDLPCLTNLFGLTRRLEFPHIYKVAAEISRTKPIMMVRMTGFHEMNLVEKFWAAHNQNIAVRMSSTADKIQLNNTRMEEGFVIPPRGVDEVIFSSLGMIR